MLAVAGSTASAAAAASAALEHQRCPLFENFQVPGLLYIVCALAAATTAAAAAAASFESLLSSAAPESAVERPGLLEIVPRRTQDASFVSQSMVCTQRR